MSEQPRPDCPSVYHETPDSDGRAHAPGAAPDTYLDGTGGGPARLPSRFALCAAYLTEPADPVPTDGSAHGTEEDGCATLPLVETLAPEEIDVLDLEEIVMWGLEGADGTFVHGRNPYDRRRLYGFFDSAEGARAFYSRWGLLRLVYA